MSAADAAHPHDSKLVVPDRLPAADVRAHSALRPAVAVSATLLEWVGVAAAIAACELAASFHPAAWAVIYVAAVFFIGARQQAFSVIGHDAVHFRYLPGRMANDVLGNLLAMWPVFISVHAFRKVHSTHHQLTGVEGDGNRRLWRTHDADGNVAPEWAFPKTPPGLALMIARRAMGLTGLRWILRGVVSSFVLGEAPALVVARWVFYGAVALALTAAGAWQGFLLYWIVPFCTWHIAVQYIRLVCEHSAVRSDEEAYRVTRTTIPTSLEALFVLPRHIGYHIEHHWYPSVPFYNLPKFHERLMQDEGYRTHAEVHRSVRSALRACTRRS